MARIIPIKNKDREIITALLELALAISTEKTPNIMDILYKTHTVSLWDSPLATSL